MTIQDSGRLARGRVEIAGVVRAFGGGAARNSVIEGCSLTLRPGLLTVLIGPSGCGKSTLAKLIAGYDFPDSGDITIDDQPVTGAGKDRLMVFQESALFNWMTTEDNALFGPRQKPGGVVPEDRARALSLLDLVGLKRFTRRYPTALSGGMQRRLEMVRALANEPDLFVLDEPFRGLDALTRSLMQKHFAEMFEHTRRTTLFITTEIDEAILLADRIIITTNKPMKVAAEIEVDLPRPRTHETVASSARANEIREQALSLLFPEAMKSFGLA